MPHSIALETLPEKAKAFAYEFVKDFNATRAAKQAGYSHKTAYRTGADLLKKPQVQQFISSITQRRNERYEISAERILLEYKRIGLSLLTDVMDWDANGIKLKNSDMLSEDVVATISEVSVTETTKSRTMKVKLYDKLKALEFLAKHTGLVIENPKELDNDDKDGLKDVTPKFENFSYDDIIRLREVVKNFTAKPDQGFKRPRPTARAKSVRRGIPSTAGTK